MFDIFDKGGGDYRYGPSAEEATHRVPRLHITTREITEFRFPVPQTDDFQKPRGFWYGIGFEWWDFLRDGIGLEDEVVRNPSEKLFYAYAVRFAPGPLPVLVLNEETGAPGKNPVLEAVTERGNRHHEQWSWAIRQSGLRKYDGLECPDPHTLKNLHREYRRRRRRSDDSYVGGMSNYFYETLDVPSGVLWKWPRGAEMRAFRASADDFDLLSDTEWALREGREPDPRGLEMMRRML